MTISGPGADSPLTAGYVGFTGYGGAASQQDVLNWTYTSGTTNINYSNGFTTNNLSRNGGASVLGTGLFN